jgi:hypothetical protein
MKRPLAIVLPEQKGDQIIALELRRATKTFDMCSLVWIDWAKWKGLVVQETLARDIQAV